MTNVSQLSDAELLSLIALPALKERESGGRAGVLGPQTKYGRAEGLTQMLPATAQAMAAKLGVPWRPELMRGTSQEAADYQERLGQAYLQEGIEKTGSLEGGLRYYHGGPDQRQWGPKTQDYARAISAKVGYAPPSFGDASKLSDDELVAALQAQGVKVTKPQRQAVAQPRKPQTGASNPVSTKPMTIDQMRAFAGVGPKKVGRGEDARKGFSSGLAQSVSGLMGQAFDAASGVMLPAPLAKISYNAALAGSNAVLDRTIGVNRPRLQPVQVAPPVGPQFMQGGLGQSLAGQVQQATNYKPQTMIGSTAKTLGTFAPAALAPGTIPQRAANVALPTLGSEGLGQFVRAIGGSDKQEELARLFGGVGGGLLSAFAFPPRVDAGTKAFGNQDTAAMRAKADEFRRAGIEPNLIDLVDESGKGVVRAAAVKQTPGRQAVEDYVTATAEDLPSRISTQARRVLSPDSRTPDQIRAAMSKIRKGEAEKLFGAVRNDIVNLGDDAMATMRVREVANAIGEAAKRERDPVTRGMLSRLEQWAVDESGVGTPPPVTIGMADRISRVLLSKAKGAAKDDMDLAATLGTFGRAIREPAKNASPGYAAALQKYGENTGLVNAAGVGEALLARNTTDEFTAQAAALNPAERDLALAAGRRAIERAAGESTGVAPGVAGRLAAAPEQQARTAALAGKAAADELSRSMSLELDRLKAARSIAPSIGPKTTPLAADMAQGAVEGARALRSGMTRDIIGLLSSASTFLKSKGMSNQQAQEIISAAITPGRADQVIRQLEAQYGVQEAAKFRSFIASYIALQANKPEGLN